MTKFIIRWVISAVGLYAAALIVPGIELRSDWVSILWLALIAVLLNMLVRPLIKFLTFPLILLTLGLFNIVINTGLLLLVRNIGERFNLGFSVDTFWHALLGSLVISAVTILMNIVFRDELKGKKG